MYVTLFFKIFVKSFTLSPYVEGMLSKFILYSKTTICESYFHWMGIMVPKWQNVTKVEYILREAAAYITFCKRQDDKCLFTKKLRQHKYASTLVGTAGQKNGRYERYILEAIKTIIPSDQSTTNAINHFFNKIRIRQEDRQQKLSGITASFESDILAKNLKMGPIKHEYRTAGADGVLSGVQHKESEKSAKPVPPFPFLKEDLLLTDEDKQRLNDIWDWSKSVQSKRKNTTNVSDTCAICNELLSDADNLVRCCNCKTSAHDSYVSSYSTGWTENDENIYCRQCIIIGNIDLNTSF